MNSIVKRSRGRRKSKRVLRTTHYLARAANTDAQSHVIDVDLAERDMVLLKRLVLWPGSTALGGTAGKFLTLGLFSTSQEAEAAWAETDGDVVLGLIQYLGGWVFGREEASIVVDLDDPIGLPTDPVIGSICDEAIAADFHIQAEYEIQPLSDKELVEFYRSGKPL